VVLVYLLFVRDRFYDGVSGAGVAQVKVVERVAHVTLDPRLVIGVRLGALRLAVWDGYGVMVAPGQGRAWVARLAYS
jgi:hypothetical protein